MKLLKSIHFDQSDSHVYAHCAGGDEWVVSGAFAFSNATSDTLKGKDKQAFSNGFLSLESFGRATFATVAEIDAQMQKVLRERLAQHFVDHYSAPALKPALPIAQNELTFIADLCAEHPINTLFTVHRFFDENGEIREEYRTITPPSEPVHTRVWEIVEE